MYEDPTTTPPPRTKTRIAVTVALLAAGVAAGAIGATALGASAGTSTSATPANYTAPTATASGGSGPQGRAYHVPELSGTVTAVGSATVTIKTSTATTSYTVTSASDIDKNGEAQLSDLVVGDAVTFNFMPDAATTINKLHAGDETKDRPAGPPADGPSTTG